MRYRHASAYPQALGLVANAPQSNRLGMGVLRSACCVDAQYGRRDGCEGRTKRAAVRVVVAGTCCLSSHRTVASIVFAGSSVAFGAQPLSHIAGRFQECSYPWRCCRVSNQCRFAHRHAPTCRADLCVLQLEAVRGRAASAKALHNIGDSALAPGTCAQIAMRRRLR
jgi:hypothetical protein